MHMMLVMHMMLLMQGHDAVILQMLVDPLFANGAKGFCNHTQEFWDVAKRHMLERPVDIPLKCFTYLHIRLGVCFFGVGTSRKVVRCWTVEH